MIEVISVRFRNGCKTYYFDPQGIQVATGDQVIVETAAGSEFASCSEGNHLVPEHSVVKPLRPLIRIATENDCRTAAYNRGREKEAFAICEKKIAAHNLEMKLIRVEINFDGSKIIFFFTADGRVDFRELVKDLASVFRSRIELRQVGVRDEAKMIGGLGICGRPLCCNQFLEEFMPVSIKMAKTQNLSLNPTKISGTCGRLMCCLKYEQNAYEDAVKRMPKNDSFVNTPDGPGNVCAVDLLREEVKVRLDESPESPRSYKGCELQILRNGKGSRDGIEIPKERPERFIRPQEREESFPLAYDFTEQPLSETPPQEEEKKPERSSRRRSRGGRNRNRDGAARKDSQTAKEPKEIQEAQPRKESSAKKENAPRKERSSRREHTPRKDGSDSRKADAPMKVERITVKASGDLTAEMKAAADRRANGQQRSDRKPREKRPPRAAGENQAKAAPAPEQNHGEGSAAGSSHRRRRPRRRKPSGGGEAPKSES